MPPSLSQTALMHRNLLAQRTMRQGRPPDRITAPLSSFDRAPAVRRYLDRSFDPCAFAGFQKPSTFRRTIPHRFQPTDKASTLPRHPAGDASCNRPHRVEPRRRRWSSSARWNKRSGIRARATLLRMHELAQIQIPVVTDRCRTPQLPGRSETGKRSIRSCASTPVAERHDSRNGPSNVRRCRENYSAQRTTVESKAEASCISVKTNDDRYDSGFQICCAAATQDAGIYDRGNVDACVSNRR